MLIVVTALPHCLLAHEYDEKDKSNADGAYSSPALVFIVSRA